MVQMINLWQCRIGYPSSGHRKTTIQLLLLNAFLHIRFVAFNSQLSFNIAKFIHSEYQSKSKTNRNSALFCSFRFFPSIIVLAIKPTKLSLLTELKWSLSRKRLGSLYQKISLHIYIYTISLYISTNYFWIFVGFRNGKLKVR